MARFAAVCLLVMLLLAQLCSPAFASKLAVLIGARQNPDEDAMHNDVVAMTKALRDRGFASSEILTLDGSVDRSCVLSLIDNVSNRISKWTAGEVLLFYSGHGTFSGDSAKTARPGLLLNAKARPPAAGILYWHELFDHLHMPRSVNLILLPDC